MDLSFSITVGASTQVALFVAPMLVLLGYSVGEHMDLHFTFFEVMAICWLSPSPVVRLPRENAIG